MKDWTYGINSLPQFKSGHIVLIEQPWWLAFIEWYIDNVIGRFCCLFHWINLPKWLYITDKDDGKKYSWYEWWGDVGALWHLYVFCPCFYWYCDHPKRIEYKVEIGSDKLKEILYSNDPKYFDDEEKNCKEILEEKD